jgi:hypothetical protein
MLPHRSTQRTCHQSRPQRDSRSPDGSFLPPRETPLVAAQPISQTRLPQLQSLQPQSQRCPLGAGRAPIRRAPLSIEQHDRPTGKAHLGDDRADSREQFLEAELELRRLPPRRSVPRRKNLTVIATDWISRWVQSRLFSCKPASSGATVLLLEPRASDVGVAVIKGRSEKACASNPIAAIAEMRTHARGSVFATSCF